MSIFICSKCEAQFPKWFGQCLECESWGTVTEQSFVNKSSSLKGVKTKVSQVVDFQTVKRQTLERIKTGMVEVDRILGGGIIPGSLILLGGQPGIGKSTLVLQIAGQLAKQTVLYISGEESAEQIKLRLDRLNISGQNLKFLGETEIGVIAANLENYKPNLAIIDSIQTLSSSEINSNPGSINQIRATVGRLGEIARKTKTAILIIGHVTKDGAMAGPKNLEHLVDVVLYLEGDRHHHFRFLRSFKNRFGSTNELGVFEMKQDGLQEVKNPSEVFLANRDLKVSGSAVASVVEGSRSLLVEVQALVTTTSFGYPQRKCSGFDINRLSLLIAVLTKRLGLHLGNKDIHINVVGGLRLREPSADLPVVLAIISAFKNKPLDPHCVSFGEVGLAGEIRTVAWIEKRIQEATKMGFNTIICPKIEINFNRSKIKITQIKNLSEAVAQLF